MFLVDPVIHDYQHLWASAAGAVAGINIFLIYYFFSRAENIQSHEANEVRRALSEMAKVGKCNAEFKWEMPWWYFVVGIVLFAFAGSAIACTSSLAIRQRDWSSTVKK